MQHNIVAAVIIAAGLIVAGFLYGGRYYLLRLNGQTVALLDRWNGAVRVCTIDGPGDPCEEWVTVKSASPNAMQMTPADETSFNGLERATKNSN